MSPRLVEPPDYQQLVAELGVLRKSGIVHLRDLELPALSQACRAAGHAEPDGKVDAPLIEGLLRTAVEAHLGSRVGDAAAVLFGLEPGTRAESPTELRRSAAENWGVSLERFRREPQATVLAQIADTILGLVHTHHQRAAHLDLERRLPPTSRLAFSWLERFEAYYRIWTPVSGLGGDLTAYRSTLIDPEPPIPEAGSTDEIDRDAQAAGYVAFALWQYSLFLARLGQFMIRHGGLWLLSDSRAEQDVADATYRIGWHSPNNERDDSYLRDLCHRAGYELHPFLAQLAEEVIGRETLQEWQNWAKSCHCTWVQSDVVDAEHFPTHRHHPGIAERCQVHALITACGDYCALIDDDWQRIADWYHLPPQRLVPIDAGRMYNDLRVDTRHSGVEHS